jgi:hypothetical protein
VDFRPVVRKTSDIFDKIIPFFNKYPLQGVKVDDYADFCKVAIIKKKQRSFNTGWVGAGIL